MLAPSITREVESDLLRRPPVTQRHAWVKAAYRGVDEFLPYLVAALFFGLQCLISQLTAGGVNLLLMSGSVLIEAGLILRWSRRHYGS